MLKKIESGTYNISNQIAYLNYIKQNRLKRINKKNLDKDFISILIIGNYNLEKCIKFIKKQKYKRFEILLYKEKYKKYKTIDSLKQIESDYCLLMNSNCMLDENALQYFSFYKNNNDFIYCDNDLLDRNDNRLEPQFKPDYSPDTLLSTNYIGSLAFIKTKIINNIDFNNLYDLYLKILDDKINIFHISEVLYHECPTNVNVELTKKSIEKKLERDKIKAEVIKSDNYDGFYIKYPNKNEKVTIIIPIKDNYEDTKKCIDSIYKNTTYRNFEILLVNNKSEEERVLKLIKAYEKKYSNFKILNADYEFNYSKINNDACKKIKNGYIVFLNNDIEIITKNWIELMLGYARQSHVGAVGVKLLYPDNTIQHGGIVIIDSPKNAFSTIPSDIPIWGGRTSIPYNYSAVTAACMMIDLNKFKKIKGFDEKLKVAYNDIDLCLKLIKCGLYNVYLPVVKMYHYESKTRGLELTEEKKKRLEKEKEIFYNKWSYKDKYYNKNYSQSIPFEIEIK